MSEPMTLDDRQHFFHRYDKFVRDRTYLCLEAFTTRFGHLKAALQALHTSLGELNTYRAREFNLFRLLGIDRYEVTTHGLDQGIGHLASMSPQKNERLTPKQG